MPNLDELSIQIQSDSQRAEEAINSLVHGLENLNSALGNLDTGKITSFSNAVSKLTRIGSATDTTSKAIKGLARDISSQFGIKTQKGIKDVTDYLTGLYDAEKHGNTSLYGGYLEGLQDVIKEHYRYRVEVDETTKSVKNYIDATNKAGGKVAMADMAKEYGGAFKEMSQVLGKAFKNNEKSTKEGYSDLAEYLTEMNSVLGTHFDTETVEKGFEQLVETVRKAKDTVLDFKSAAKEGLTSNQETFNAADTAAEKIHALLQEQSKYNASSGLSGLVTAFQQISDMHIPDMSGMADAVKTLNANPPKETAKVLSEVANEAQKVSQSFNEMMKPLDRIATTKEPLLALPEWDKMLPAVIRERDAIQKYHKQLYESDLGKTWESNFTPKQEPVLALPMFDKMLPAVVQTQSAVDSVYKSIEDVVNESPKLDAVSQAFYDWKSSLIDTARMMEETGASFEKWRVPEAGSNPSFSRDTLGWVSDIQPEAVEGYFYDIEESANKCLPAIANVGTTALATADQFKAVEEYAKQAYEKTRDSFEGFKSWDLGTGLPDSFDAIAEEATKAKSAIEKAIEAARNFRQTISDMESGKKAFNEEEYQKAIKGYEEATKAVNEYKEAVLGVGDDNDKSKSSNEDVLTNLVELGDALGELSEKFEGLAEKATSVFKWMVKPLEMVAEEYKEKFANIGKHFTDFASHVKTSLAKISAFWKRAMRTFTFMLVRKAITAIIKEINNAIQSMAKFSDAMGTKFNESISLLVADFQYLGRSIVSVFAPLINFIAPIIDAIVDKIALLLSWIGMLMAALTGASSFTKAKKNIGNYAKSLDGASKAAKNLTMGIDELNILAESSGGGSSSPYDGWEDAWEEVDIPDWIKDLADKIKGIFADLLEPIKKAWEEVKEYFKFAFEYMKDQAIQLAESIWKAFITVWKQDKTVELFKTLFRIIADIMIVVGNLAKKFREAWDDAGRGVKIFEGIRDIILILAEHVRNVSWYMVRWSSEIDFKPLLDGVINLLNHLEKLADFLGGVFEDVMKNVVLKYIKFMIEEGLPHLMEKISEVIDAFGDFQVLREKLQPLETSFEQLWENIDKGITNAIGNLGEHIAEFTQSETFDNFLASIQHIMDSISEEDVEKILTGIGEGILKIVEALAKFVGSEGFNNFIDKLDEWMQNATTEDIADMLTGIATAIGMFKFAAFATEKLAGFFKFAAIIVSLKNLHDIAAGLTAVGEGGAVASGGFAAIAGPAAMVAILIASIALAVYSLIKSFGGLSGFLDEIKRRFDDAKMVAENFAKAIKLDKSLKTLGEQLERASEKLGDLKDVWDVVLDVIGFVVDAFIVSLEPAIKVIIDLITGLVSVAATAADVLGGFGTVIKSIGDGIVSGDWSSAWEGVKDGGERIKNAILEGITGVDFSELGNATYDKTDEAIHHTERGSWGKLPAGKEVGEGIAESIDSSYSTAAKSTESTMKATTKTMINNGIDVVGDVDYAPVANQHTQKMANEFYYSAGALDWASYGTLVNTEAGNSILNQDQPFTDANKTTAQSGAEQFSSEYANYFNGNTEIADALGIFGETSGLELANGFNNSITVGEENTTLALLSWFGSIKGTMNRQMEMLKAMFSNMLTNVFSANGADIVKPLNDLFQTVEDTFAKNINELGDMLLNSILPVFMQTNIMPFFNTEKWQPLFDNLLNMVFIPQFEQFKTWFDDSMLTWWADHMLFWFTAEKWDEDIFIPLAENIHEHFSTFSDWWDATMLAWWNNQVEPWFEYDLWKDLFDHILKAVKEVFLKISEEIQERILEAAEVVVEACREMKNALQEVLDLINQVMESLKEGFGDMSGVVTFNFGGEYATGGFPQYGSLFLAGEPGAGAELVGNIHGRTGVVSNGEITGIEDAVYATGSAETELLSTLVSLTRAMLDKDPVVITDKDIARLNNSGQGKIGMSIIS